MKMAWKVNWIEKLSKNSIGYEDGFVAWAEVTGWAGTRYLYLTNYGTLAGGTDVPDGVRRKVKERMIKLVNKPEKKPTAKKTAPKKAVKKKAAPRRK